MKVKITSKEVKGLEDMHYDLSIPSHFGAFTDKLADLFTNEKEFSILEMTEQEIYIYNLNHH